MSSMQDVQAKYKSGAGYYDRYVYLYRLIGLRVDVYRERAVELLHLEPGDHVLDLGCGTGLSFPLIMETIGTEGRLIGVDLNPRMLARAQNRVERAGWTNVELVHSDASTYALPRGLNGVISVGLFGYLKDQDRVVKAAAEALVPGGRLVILDGKRPEHWPSWLFRLFVLLGRPFGLTMDYFKGRPWESVERHLQDAAMEQLYGRAMYISSGTAPPRRPKTT